MTRTLIHIGYPKAGSTFLQSWFEQHPELFYKPGGIGGFRDVYELARPLYKDFKYFVSSYESLSMPSNSAGRIKLIYGGAEVDDDDHTYRSQLQVCTALKSLFPESTILIITRGFKDIILSGYSQYLRVGGVKSLDELCRDIARQVREETLHFYDFDRLISIYRSAFGRENVIVLPFELLRDDKVQFLSTVEERLGLDHHDISIDQLNPSLSPSELYWYPRISRVVSGTASRLGAGRFKRIYTWYVKKTLENKFSSLVRVLNILKPGRSTTRADFPVEILEDFRGLAESLRELPEFAPYGSDYLWRN